MYNILFTNAGRRGTLLKNFKQSIGKDGKVIATDNWSVAPALFLADKYYLTPKINEKHYLDSILEICEKEKIQVITSLIDPEISILAENRQLFLDRGIIPLCPSKATADLCFDKYKMFLYLKEQGIKTVSTYSDIDDFDIAFRKGDISFPVFVKPRTGSGSVGAQKVHSYEELKLLFLEDKFDYIIQEYMNCEDFDADVYVDTITNQAVSAFSKRKIETRIGGASKTISFKDKKLFKFIEEIVSKFEFYGPLDMDFFYKDGEYYLSEVNPRLGGAYLHAYGSGVDFPKLIANNVKGIANTPCFGEYEEGILMLMYDEVVITKVQDLKGDYND